jgi:site-specific DNA recombinase
VNHRGLRARLARYREALEAGTDPTLVAGVDRRGPGERRRAGEEIRRCRPATPLSEADIRAMVESLGDLVRVLQAAAPAKKAALHESLGLTLTHDLNERRVLVEADFSGVRTVRVGGGT